MAEESLAQVSAKLFDLLSPLSSEDRARVVKAVLVLCGDTDVPVTPTTHVQGTSQGQGGQGGVTNAEEFFALKDPQNKGELLAVAARFREEQEQAETHSKDELKRVIQDARRNFDDHNFGRDIKNAKRQAQLFNLGTDRDAHTLSYYGKQYVDAMPDREAVKAVRKPKSGGNRKKAKAKSTKKK